MTYAIHEHQNIQIIQVHDLYNEVENLSILKDITQRLLTGKFAFVVDLSDLDYMNSIGLNFLIRLMSAARNNNIYLALANANEQVIKLLKVTKLYPLFRITASVEEAFQEVESS